MNKKTQYICVAGSSKVGKTTTIEAILERGENMVVLNNGNYECEMENSYNHITEIPDILNKKSISKLEKSSLIILVIQLADGLTPEEREYIFLAKNLGIEKLAILVNNCDLKDSLEKKCFMEMEIRDLLDCILPYSKDIPIIFESSLDNLKSKDDDSIDELVKFIDSKKEKNKDNKVLKKIKK